MNTPIIIICKDRVNYLDIELKSLSATLPRNTQVYISNDGTTSKQMIEYLTTNNKIYCDKWMFPNYNNDWNNIIGILPVTDIVGIKGKVQVILYEKSEGTKNLGLSVKYVFENSNSDYVIKMEDDLIFTKGWYQSLIKAIISSGCDLVSGFRYFFGEVKIKPINELTEEICSGWTGGQLMIVSRNYYKHCPYVFNNDIKTIWNNDDLWIDECRKAGLRFAVTKKSICQHIGFQTESKQKGFIKDGKLLKIDPKVFSIVFGTKIEFFKYNIPML